MKSFKGTSFGNYAEPDPFKVEIDFRIMHHNHPLIGAFAMGE